MSFDNKFSMTTPMYFMLQLFILYRSDKYYNFAPGEKDKKNNAVFRQISAITKNKTIRLSNNFTFHKIIVRT